MLKGCSRHYADLANAVRCGQGWSTKQRHLQEGGANVKKRETPHREQAKPVGMIGDRDLGSGPRIMGEASLGWIPPGMGEHRGCCVSSPNARWTVRPISWLLVLKFRGFTTSETEATVCKNQTSLAFKKHFFIVVYTAKNYKINKQIMQASNRSMFKFVFQTDPEQRTAVASQGISRNCVYMV